MQTPYIFNRTASVYWIGSVLVMDVDGQLLRVRSGPGAAGYHAQCIERTLITPEPLPQGARALAEKEWAKAVQGIAQALLHTGERHYRPPVPLDERTSETA